MTDSVSVSNAKILETIQQMQRDIFVKMDGLTDKTSELHTQLQVVCNNVRQISEITEMSRRTLRGSNGDPGLVASVQEVRHKVEKIENVEKNCGLADVKSMIYGSDKFPGLIERVRDLEELGATLRKWTYLAGSAVLLGIISLLFDVIPKIMNLINQGG